MSSETKLFEMAKEVYGDLNDVFKFKYSDVFGQICSLKDPTVQKMYKSLLGIRGKTKEAAEEDLAKRLSGELQEECHYVDDVFNNKIDYIIFVPDESSVTPMVLGEEVTHGEHTSQHIRDIGSHKNFKKSFSVQTREFMGMMGVLNILKNYPDFSINLITPKISDTGIDQYDLDHWVGYLVASQLVASGKEIPYSDLFHAADQKTVWNMTKEIIKPSIFLPKPAKDKAKDVIAKVVEKTLKDCELDASFHFLK
ncbi:MAG: hypothetical protein KAS32_18510 [Candidatus Peribacteraceae bacterium]|nr:hypothetical protein [Candidatus Peribacteraceae bacterium]